LCCGADAFIRYPRSGSSVVGKSGRALKRIFCGVQREALVVFLADRKRIEWNDDGLLVDAQEAADTYHRDSDAAILLDYEIEDVANLVIGRIIYTLFEEIGHGRNVAGIVDIKRAECPTLPGADCAIGAKLISTMIVAAADVSRITIMNSLPRLGIDRSSDKPDARASVPNSKPRKSINELRKSSWFGNDYNFLVV
jgi:hypothetical protein